MNFAIKLLIIAILAIVPLISNAAGVTHHNIGAQDCESFTKNIIEYTQKNVSLSQKKAFLLQNIDTKFITKFVLGSSWRSLSPEQRKEFYEVYSKYVVYKYAIYLGQYKVLSYTIVSVTNDERRPEVCNVLAMITTKIKGEKTEIPLVAVVANSNGTFLMQDILFKNLGILQIQQQEISAIVKSEGYDKTLQTLEEFVESQK